MGKSFIYYQHKARLLDSVYVGQLYSLARIAGAEPLGLKFTKKSVRYYFFLIQNKHKKEMTACVSKMLEYVPVISFPRATLYNRTDWHSFQGLNRWGFHFQNESCDCKIPELRGISHYHNEQLIAGRVNITDIRHPPMRGSM